MHFVLFSIGHVCFRQMRGPDTKIEYREEQRQTGVELLRDILSQKAGAGTNYYRGELPSNWTSIKKL